MNKALPSGLYAVTPQDLPSDILFERTEAILKGGARVLQYRSKVDARSYKRDEALVLQGLCKDFGALLIINDDLDLALELSSDGVHLGQDDAPLSLARQAFPGIIGISCYASVERAREAVLGGADYIAFGSMAPSPTKPWAPSCPPEVLGHARALGRPVVAIGGITLENARSFIDAGADALAVISALYEVADPESVSQQFCALWSPQSHES